jgi:hypothetical protein
MSDAKGKIIDAYAEWDDPRAFRVYLVREGADDDGAPMRAHYSDDGTVEARLYRGGGRSARRPKQRAAMGSLRRLRGWTSSTADAWRPNRPCRQRVDEEGAGAPSSSSRPMARARLAIPASSSTASDTLVAGVTLRRVAELALLRVGSRW